MSSDASTQKENSIMCIHTLTWNFAVFKDQLTGVGSPHAEFVELLCSRKSWHSLQEAHQQPCFNAHRVPFS